MKEIQGKTKSVSELLTNVRYTIGYYQREYNWEQKQVTELIDDLSEKFFQSYREDHERSDVRSYGFYFLGSIIVSETKKSEAIIDGQQRLTTLTLMLIYIHKLLEEPDHKSQISKLIFSQQYGQKSFNIDVPERKACIEALYKGENYEGSKQSESVRNILDRYSDIEEYLPEGLTGEKLPFFVDWLIQKVHLVKITTYSDEDAYTIFETMNDRGLSLTPTDMLKGYLLSKIKDEEQRFDAGTTLKKRIQELRDLGKSAAGDGIKAWLRSQHAQNIRERSRGSKPGDFDLIGTQFHRWIRDHLEPLGLKSSENFIDFIEKDFEFYTSEFIRLRKAAETFTEGLEQVFCNAQSNFTLQYPVILAPLNPEDSEEEKSSKIRITSTYLDILIARRIWNWKRFGYSSMQYAMFLLMHEIRGKDIPDLVQILRNKLDSESKVIIASDSQFQMTGQNARHVHNILARITAHIETMSGQANRYPDYIVRSGKHGYDIEHIWAKHYERHTEEFDQSSEFDNYRNRIGALLLLPKSFNRSYSDLPYEEKRDHYNSDNLLARTLHEKCYERNPGFLRYMEENGLPFKPHAEFKRDDLDARQELYVKVAEEIWNPDRLEQELSA